MLHPFGIPIRYFTWATMALALLFAVAHLLLGNGLSTALALRAYADAYPPLAAYPGATSAENTRTAERLIDKAIIANPDNQSLWRAQGWLRNAKGDESASLQSWSHVDTQADELVWLADRQLDSGDTSTALEYYTIATQLTPDTPDSWNRLGQAHMQLSQWRQAAEAFQHAADIEPPNRSYWYRLGEAYAELGDAVSAVDAFTQALTSVSDDIGVSQTHYALGKILADLETTKSRDDAIGHFSAALEQDDFGDKTWVKADTHYRRGKVHAERKAWSLAIDDYRAAIQANPQHTRVRIALATAFWKTDKPQQAVQILEEAIGLTPDSITAHIRLADYLTQLGDIESATTAYEAALQIEPGNEYVQRRLRRLQQQSPTP